MKVDRQTIATPYLYQTEFFAQELDPLRIDNFLKLQYESLSREFLKKKILNQEVFINNNVLKKTSQKVFQGDKVLFVCKNENFLEPPKIIHENENFLVINKPAFMTTHLAGKEIFNVVPHFFPFKVYPVHRLDKETSGILILAKNSKTAHKLCSLFEKREVQKEYLLVTYKQAHSLNFFCDQPLKIGITTSVHASGKSAFTEFSVIKKEKNYTLVLAKPKTGRQHQIRVHASFCNIPLVGDKLYGDYPFKRQLLHAHKITIDGQSFTAEIPQDFLDFMG